MIKIRNEQETDYKIVEDITRKAFYNIYPAAMMVKELKPNALENKKWTYYDSPVMKIDEKEAGKFDMTLEKMEKNTCQVRKNSIF